MTKTLTAIGVLAMTGAAFAQFDLQITEMWPGNEPGENLTSDWFEITNFGDTAWTIADGALYYDDDSADPTTADPLQGVTTIAPGESVIFVDDADTVEWLDFWSTGLPAGTQVGVYAGSGLGGGGDAVTLFFDAGDLGVEASDIIDSEAFPFADDNGGQSWDVILGTFSTVGNAAGAYATILPNDENQFGIGSPGSVVPTPGAAALLGLAGIAGLRRRRA